MQTSLTEAQSQISALEADRTQLEQTIADLVGRREELTSDTAAAEEQRARVQEQLTELSGALSRRSDEVAELERRISRLQDQGAALTASAATGGGGAAIAPGAYAAGPVTATFDADGTFQMTHEGRSQAARGAYSIEAGVLTLSDTTGDVGSAQFPMRCAVEATATGFSLAVADDGSCTLAGVTFEPKS